MSSSELTLLDLKNLLECFELIPVDSKNDEKFQRTQEKIRGLFNIHEDSSEPLMKNLISSTLVNLELYTDGDLKSAKSLLLNRKVRLEEDIRQCERQVIAKNGLLESKISSLQHELKSYLSEVKDALEITRHEVSKVNNALDRIDKKLEEFTDG